VLRDYSCYDSGPIDAVLREMVVSSPRVPARVRQDQSVEAGLKAGLSVPLLIETIWNDDHHGSTEE